MSGGAAVPASFSDGPRPLLAPGSLSGGAPPPPPPAQRLLQYSPYEVQTIKDVLGARGEVRDPFAGGKTVESIDIVPLDVFEKRDLLPTWLNVFHVTTRQSVVEHEVLLREGAPYTQALADDTIRNLRRAPVVPQVSCGPRRSNPRQPTPGRCGSSSSPRTSGACA